jgi:hypothetical protein
MLQLGGHGHRPWLSVDDRCRPMLRARWGHGRRGRTRRSRAGDGHQLDRRVRPLLGDRLPCWQEPTMHSPSHAYSESRSGRGRGPITPGIEHAEAEHGHAGRGHHAKSTLNRLPRSATDHGEKSALSPRSMDLAYSAKTLRSGPMNKARRRAEAAMPRPSATDAARFSALYLFTVNNHSFCCAREMPATSCTPVVSTAL